MQKILFIAPHLSTGGMPQYLYKEMESINNDFDIYCIEWDDVTGGQLVIQRNKIQNLLGKKLITLGDDKHKLFDYINEINPDIIHLQEIPEHFIPYDIANKLYSENRKYIIIETSHDSSGNPDKKMFFPDKFMFVSKWQIEQYKSLKIPSVLMEYPIEYVVRTKTREEILKELGLDPKKKHVINVGLFTQRKNQAEVIEYARKLEGYPIQFHFIGNQADNFKYYWEPLMKNFPKNCKWWGERSDVETFYQMADLMLFTSRGTDNDKETSPLVIREAISNRTPSLIYNLPVYLGMYNNYDNLKFLNFDDKEENIDKILKELNLKPIEDTIAETFIYETTKGTEDLLSYKYTNSCQDALIQYGEGAGQYWSIFLYHEMDRGNISIENGDVFYDLGSNIGMSSKYAILHGASEVHCFEPDPNLRGIIRKNIPEAFIYDNAISNEEKEIELYHWPHNPVYVGPKYKCQTLNLSSILKSSKKPIDYMKIDIEGFEEHLFDDVSISELSKVHKIFIECHFTPTNVFCENLENKGFDLWVDESGKQTLVYAKNKHYKKYVHTPKETQITHSTNKDKIHIIDAYATTEEKLNILRQNIKSVKKFGGDIMLVSHCSFPQDIIDSVNYHIYDADNTFNDNHVFGFRKDENIEIEHNITKSHEFPIIRSMRLSITTAQQLGYKYFMFTEFDHIYSNDDVIEINKLEQQLILENKDFLFFQPLFAQFGDIIGQYFETCLFLGLTDKFLIKFNEFFPQAIEDYNKYIALKFPNCLEYFFYHIFEKENCLIIRDYVKSYLKTSVINLSSWSDYEVKILVDKDDNAYLTIINNNIIDYRFEIDVNGEVKNISLINGYHVIKLTNTCNIKINVYSETYLIGTRKIIYNKNDHDTYKKSGYIKIFNSDYIESINIKDKLFKTEFNKRDNKITFTYLGTDAKNILISIKDIDSKACIFSSNWGVIRGASYWMIPLPMIVIDFFNDPQFGGFLIEYRENGVLIETEKMRFKTLPYTKPIMDLSDTEPIFMNYREFFDEGIYNKLRIKNSDVVFDIGANIGLWTAFILSQGAKKVYCFEPNRLAINQLNRNFKNNENVVIIPKGIYYKHTKIPFYIDDENSLISSMINGDDKVAAYEVETVTIDEMISEYNIDKIDLLKMDIEGAEFDIFDNITTDTINKVNSLLIEYHDFYFPDGEQKVEKLIRQLEEFGFMVNRPEGIKFIFATKVKKTYWITDGDTSNLKEENIFDDSKMFSWHLMNEGILTGYHHQIHELYFTNDLYTNGCIYERYGCVIEKGDVVVDVGANIGTFTNMANEKGAEKIYCFEPGDSAMACLEKNAPKNAELYKFAIGDTIGETDLYFLSEGNTMCATNKLKSTIKNTAHMTTIDGLFTTGVFNKIDFLKIDAEGSEFDIIKGISDDNIKKIKKIALEYHSNILDETKKDYIWERMMKEGFKGFELMIGDGTLRIYNFWRE